MPRRLVTPLLGLVLALAGATGSQASIGPPPPVDAESALVATAGGEILYESDGDERLPMASITKLMTAIVALEELRPGRTVSVDPAAVGITGSSIFLRPGERLPVRDLLAAALIQSANDAAYALAAAATDGDVAAFVRRMNRTARELGLEDTHFANPSGLDAPGHYSSARDILVLAREAMRSTDRREARPTARRDDRRRQEPLLLERPARCLPGRLRREDRPHERRRLVPGRGRAASRAGRLRGDPRQPGPHGP